MPAAADFIIDFQSTEFDIDRSIAKAVLTEYQTACSLEESFALASSGSVGGWTFARLTLSAGFVQALYDGNSYEIEGTNGRTLTDKFIGWLNDVLKQHGCRVLLKAAEEMYDRGYGGGN